MVITIAVQSSSATTVMLVGLVNSGLMKLSQTLFVIYGANIGTTITSWILSLSGIQSDNIGLQMLKPENFSPIVALIGILMLMLSHNDRKKSIGTVFVGFAVLIYGMKMMSDAVSPLADSPGFAAMLTKFNIPLVGMLIGTLFTGVIQSSAATIGILQALSMTGSLTNAMIIPVVMGANIGHLRHLADLLHRHQPQGKAGGGDPCGHQDYRYGGVADGVFHCQFAGELVVF